MSTKGANHRKQLGAFGETFVRQYLVRTLGWRILLSNWRCRFGEIDIVGQDVHCLVIVEVRTRQSRGFGSAVESVDWKKVRRLRKLSERLLYTMPELTEYCNRVRIDVIGLTVQNGAVYGFQHLRNAVDAFSS